MRIGVIGAGHVGVVTGACLCSLGNDVFVWDIETERVRILATGRVPWYEPELTELVQTGLESGRLHFCTQAQDALEGREVIFLTVGTPTLSDGRVDLSELTDALSTAARFAGERDVVIANRSTVQPGTLDGFQVGRGVLPAANPEFCREGSAVADFMHPSRVVLGSRHAVALDRLQALYEPLGAPILRTDPPSAEMIKMAANAYLSVRLSFINEIANLSEAAGAQVADVVKGLSMDPRIGKAYLRPGLGFWGPCLEKDVRALLGTANALSEEFTLGEAAIRANQSHLTRLVDRLRARLGTLRGKRIGLLGVSFKPGTDDVRGSPAWPLAAMLDEGGAHVRAWDPAVREWPKEWEPPAVAWVGTPYQVATGVDALIVVTPWPEIGELDLRMVVGAMNGSEVQPAILADPWGVWSRTEIRHLDTACLVG